MRYCIRCANPLTPTHLDGRQRLSCASCGWLWLDLPNPVVLVLAVAPSGRVVLTRDDRFPADRWGLVAGFIERGEDPCDAALRELFEEAGLQGRNARVVGADHWRDNVFFCVRCEIPDATVIPEDGTQVRLAIPQQASIVEDSPASRLVATLASG